MKPFDVPPSPAARPGGGTRGKPLGSLLFAVLIVLAGLYWTHVPAPADADAKPARTTTTVSGAAAPAESGVKRRLVGPVTITDQRTGKTVTRTVDLQPTLDRIAAGRRDDHPNDGGVYRNHSGALPRKPSGYYREYVVPTEGMRGPGPQRLVIGREGELYYTPDHYSTFIAVDAEK